MQQSQSKVYFRFVLFLISFIGNVEANPPSTANGLATEPLFLGGNAEPNILFDIDDSVSMDWEIQFPGLPNGLLRWDSEINSFIKADGTFVTAGKDYGYIFPNGVSAVYNGKRIESRRHAIPPVKAYAFARSSDYNPSYYNPKAIYTPWPSYGGFSFIDSTPTNAKFEPVTSFTGGGMIDLTTTRSVSGSGETFTIQSGMSCDDLGTTNCLTDAHISFFPATYYTKDNSASIYYYSDNSGTFERQCNAVLPEHYHEFVASPSSFLGIDAIGPEGACLIKTEIKPTNFSNSGEYEVAIQNFANWFTYYRRRHQAIRGGLAAALEGVSGIRTGMFWFNNLVDPIIMGSFDSAQVPTPLTPGHVETFMKNHYTGVPTSGNRTPTRQSLEWAGKQYSKTGSTAPITSSCQRNYTLVFTDGFANELPETSVGNTDKGTGEPYEDDYSDTLADIAMKYYSENIRPDLISGQSPVSLDCNTNGSNPWTDCNKNLHMNTVAVGLNAVGEKFGVTHALVRDAYDNVPTWENPTDEGGVVQADDLYHAAVNGRGEVYSANSPEGLKTAMQEAVIDIIESASEGGASSVAFNTSSLESSSVVMTASFSATQWSGELEAFALNSSSDSTNGDIQGSVWKASVALDKLSTVERYILTYDGNSSKTFHWENLTSVQKDDLKTAPDGTQENETAGRQRLEFLRGDRSQEGTNLRNRQSILGDIIHSSPVFVGSPEHNYPEGTPFGTDTLPYSSFKNNPTIKARTPVVYIGANDGMLHGFITEGSNGGKEVFAYVPNALYSKETREGLHYLTDPSYTHRNYVDGTPVVADVYLNGWKTVLVGSFRGGAKGIFALDVTDPNDFTDQKAADRVLWEFTDAPDLGYINGKPVVAMMNNNQWAVIFGNGYGGTATKLFIVYIDGSGYEVIDTGVSSNGLSEPALADLDANGTVDRIYAGDLGGNLWAFDVSSSNSSKWASAYTGTNGNKTPLALFTSVNAVSEIQPITSAPSLVANPNVQTNTGNGIDNNEPNVLVLFGTGQYLVGGDLSNTDQQSFYAIWDEGSPSLNRTNLEPRTITNVSGFRLTTGENVDWEPEIYSQRQFGWHLDFNVNVDLGERVVLTPNVRGEVVFFNTLIPSVETCSAGGSGYLMSVNLLDGLTPDSAVFDNTNDGIDESDVAYSGQYMENIPMDSGFLSDTQYTPTNLGTIESREIDDLTESDEGRLSWIELLSD